MNEYFQLEEQANSLLKKITVLLDNLSYNVSKEKTEKALSDGYECMNEIEKIINQINNIKDGNYSKQNLFMLKGDLMQKKEKYEKIRKEYIIYKNNELIESLSSENTQEYEENIIYKKEEQIAEKEDLNNGEETFQVNSDIAEMSEEFLYNDNILFRFRRRIKVLYSKTKNVLQRIKSKTKYLIVLSILIFLLICCIVGLLAEIFEYIK